MIATNKQITCFIYTFPKDTLPNFNHINSLLEQLQVNGVNDISSRLIHHSDEFEEVLFVTKYRLTFGEIDELYQSFKLFENNMWNYVKFL